MQPAGRGKNKDPHRQAEEARHLLGLVDLRSGGSMRSSAWLRAKHPQRGCADAAGRQCVRHLRSDTLVLTKAGVEHMVERFEMAPRQQDRKAGCDLDEASMMQISADGRDPRRARWVRSTTRVTFAFPGCDQAEIKARRGRFKVKVMMKARQHAARRGQDQALEGSPRQAKRFQE